MEKTATEPRQLPRPTWLRKTRLKPALLVVAVLALALFPVLTSGYWVRLLSGVFMFASLALSLNVIVGFTGRADFGNVVFFGVGGYATALLMSNLGWSLPAAVLAGGVLSALYATVLGLPILRLQGHYFAIATIGILEFTRAMVLNLRFTGGSSGTSVPFVDMPPVEFNRFMYFIFLGLMVTYALGTWWMLNSRVGYALRAIKADPETAAASGIHPTIYRVVAWSTSAFLTGIVGGFNAFMMGYIEPPFVFDILVSVKYWIMLLLGGAGTILGPIVGAFVLETISEWVWSRYLEWHLGALGVLMVLIVIFVPNGFARLAEGRLTPADLLDNIRQNRI